MIPRWHNLLPVRQRVHTRDKHDKEASEESEGSLEGPGWGGGGERSFKQGDEGQEEEEGGGSSCSGTALHEEHVDETEHVHQQEHYPGGVSGSVI